MRAIGLGDDTIYRDVRMVLSSARGKDELVQELLQSAKSTLRASPFAYPLLERF